MRKVVPLEKKVESQKGVDLLKESCNYINNNLDDFTNDDYEELTKLCLYLLTGFKKENINTSFFNTICKYLKENIGRLEIDFSNNHNIHQIRLGNIKMGSLSFKEFSLLEKKERIEKKISCCGSYPTMDRKERMFLTIDNKLIMGNQAIIGKNDYDNLYIGEYYFNRNSISPNKASATRLKLFKDNTIDETIYEYDELGEINRYEAIVSIERHRNNEYFVSSSIDKKDLFRNRYGIRPSNTSSIRIK